MFDKYISLILLTVLIHGCNSTTDTKKNDSLKVVPLLYAKRFNIKTSLEYTVLELYGDKTNTNITASFVLYKIKT